MMYHAYYLISKQMNIITSAIIYDLQMAEEVSKDK